MIQRLLPVLAVVASALSFAAAPAPKVDGALDPRMVQTVIASNAHEVDACYQAYVKAHPDTSGVLVLHWTVRGDGTVEEACQSRGTTIPAELGRCVSDKVTSWSFPSPGYAQQASVEYTFSFTRASARPAR